MKFGPPMINVLDKANYQWKTNMEMFVDFLSTLKVNKSYVYNQLLVNVSQGI